MLGFIKRHPRLFGITGAIVALTVAIIYWFVIPAEANEAQGIARYILLYGHSLCWVLLAAASLVWGLARSRRYVNVFAYAALAVYVVFLITLFSTKM